MAFETVGIRYRHQEKPKLEWNVTGQARIAAVTLETGEINHGQMWLYFRETVTKGQLEWIWKTLPTSVNKIIK